MASNEGKAQIPSPIFTNQKPEGTCEIQGKLVAEEKSKKEQAAPKDEKKHEKKLNLKDLIKKHLQAGACKMEYEILELHQLLDLAKVSMQKMSTLVELTAPVNVCELWIAVQVSLFIPWRVYGFYAELRTCYQHFSDSKALYDHFNEVFSEMPLAALVSGKILCMHGGLSPFLNSLNDIRNIKRPISVVRGLAQDLLWADPEAGIKGFQSNKVRAVSDIFDENVVFEKTKQLKIDMVIRAHQLVTIFSAARYHEDLCNYAAIVQIDERLELSFMQLKPTKFE